MTAEDRDRIKLLSLLVTSDDELREITSTYYCSNCRHLDECYPGGSNHRRNQQADYNDDNTIVLPYGFNLWGCWEEK